MGESSPTAQVLVPVLAAFGLTDEPVELECYGAIPASIARELLNGWDCFLRGLTDPVAGEHLDPALETYRIRKKERAMLRARDQA